MDTKDVKNVNEFLGNLEYLDEETLDNMDFYGLALYLETLNKLEKVNEEVDDLDE